MTDKKDDNIIVGPWTNEPVDNSAEWIKKKYDKALEKNTAQLKMQDKLARIEILTEDVMVQLIHTLSENSYDIADEKFILDIGFLSETIKGVISRQEKIPHIVNESSSDSEILLHYISTLFLNEMINRTESMDTIIKKTINR